MNSQNSVQKPQNSMAMNSQESVKNPQNSMAINGQESGQVFPLLAELTSKRVTLRIWIEKALSYYGQGQSESFILFLETGILKCVKSYPGYKDDLVRTYTLLAGHCIRLAYREVGNRRSALLAKVTNLLQVVEPLKPTDLHHFICRGYALMLSPGRAQEADNQFVAVLKKMPYNVLALMGRGCLAYNRQDYEVALSYFKNILVHYPKGPADVRVGIGHCFLQLGDLESARKSFEMALEGNGRCHNALVGIALLKLQQLEQPSHQEGINLMCAAFEQYNKHPVVLTHLASHQYFVRKYELARTLAANAIKHSDNRELMAQNYFRIGRSYHAESNYDMAFDYYTMSIRRYPHPLAGQHFCLAQMIIKRDDISMAESRLETVIKLEPNHLGGLNLLATLYLENKSSSKLDCALKLFSKVLELTDKTTDYDIYLKLARTYERKEQWSAAINSLLLAMPIYKRQKGSVPVEWLMNLSALQMYAKMPQRSVETFDLALKHLKLLKEAHSESNLLTLRFNRARMLEDLQDDEMAEKLYKEILEEYPTYTDCFLRLGKMAASRNQMVFALDYYKQALKVDKDNVTARILMGYTYMKHGCSTSAMSNHNAIRGLPGQQNDAYTLVAIGNVILKHLHQAKVSANDKSAKRCQEKALRIYRKAMRCNPNNLWAANGIGAALSSRGYLNEGECIFKMILEASGKQCPQAVLNSANVALELGQYKLATQIYKQYLEEFLPPNDVDVMQNLAQSLYLDGLTREAKIWLLKARQVSPHNSTVMYNLALVIKQDSVMIFEMAIPELAELQKAEQELKVALRYFECMATSAIDQIGSILYRARKQANQCRKILDKLSVKQQRARQEQLQNEYRQRLQVQRYQEMQLQLAQEKLQREEDEKTTMNQPLNLNYSLI